MTAGGWVTMIVSLTVVWGGTAWCYWMVLKTPDAKKVPAGYGP